MNTIERAPAASLLDVRGVQKHFISGGGLLGGPRRCLQAVDDVSFTLDAGATLSVVGESGCGKSTLARLILRLTEPTQGEIWLKGRRIDALKSSQMRPLRSAMQVVFQDPYSSLNPRLKVRDIIAEPIINFRLADSRADVDRRVETLLDMVRLPYDAMHRYPHEFSGGQRQRIGIARALAPGAELIICDEAVSALDVSVKAQIINLLGDLQKELGLAVLFISHDLAVVEHLTHRVAVMYLGRVVEISDRRTLFGAPAHPYTQALLSAVPVADPSRRRERIVLRGDLPNPANPPSGCRFSTRCPYAFDRCRIEAPTLRARSHPEHLAACHLDELPQRTVLIRKSH